jgi:hypothetical protein
MEVDPVRNSARSTAVRGALLAAIALPFGLSADPAAASETRGYVISWFATATNTADYAGDCPASAKAGVVADEEGPRRRDVAMVDGKPVSSRSYPAAVTKDPGLEMIKGKFAYGFDLGGPAKDKFADPETGQKIDNQLWRAVGCHPNFAQRPPPEMPYTEALGWAALIDASPGWAMQITGEDLSKDGPVTITLDRTLRHLERDAQFNVRSNATYVLDPSPRSNNVLQGEIREGVLTVKSGDVFMLAGFPFYTSVDLTKTVRSWGTGAATPTGTRGSTSIRRARPSRTLSPFTGICRSSPMPILIRLRARTVAFRRRGALRRSRLSSPKPMAQSLRRHRPKVLAKSSGRPRARQTLRNRQVPPGNHLIHRTPPLQRGNHYCAGKGVVRFGRSVAHELIGQKIRLRRRQALSRRASGRTGTSSNFT